MVAWMTPSFFTSGIICGVFARAKDIFMKTGLHVPMVSHFQKNIESGKKMRSVST